MNFCSDAFKTIHVEDYEFIKMEWNHIEFIFSTAVNNLNFNKASEEGKKNLERLKNWFHVSNIAYLNQVHSNIVYKADDNIYDGDALINDRSDIASGVFTADCVPVLIADAERRVVAAVHSGWKGTLNCVVMETINKMKKDYNVRMEDLKVVIGPHIRDCCYEVGEDVISAFRDSRIYGDKNIASGRMLSLEKCIRVQLELLEVPCYNILSAGICTKCSKEYDMYSYRRDPEVNGRMFSFIIMR